MNGFKPKKILVPTDSFEPAKSALEAAKTLGRRYGSRLELVFVQEPPLSLMGLEPAEEGLAAPALLRQLSDFRRWRRDSMLKEAAPYPPSRLSVRTLEGWPPGELAKLAQPRCADLVVMGTHGRAGLSRAVMGSVTEIVLRRAGVPVLAVHSRWNGWKPSRILVPFNFEPYAEEALKIALAVAGTWKARLSVLYAAGRGENAGAALKALESRVRSLAGRVAFQALVKPGEASAEILKQAERGQSDLIVLSAHRKPLLKDAVLGSTAERLLRHGGIPTLCVPTGRSSTADWGLPSPPLI